MELETAILNIENKVSVSDAYTRRAWAVIRAALAEALKPSHNTQSTAIAQIAARIDVLADALHDRGEIEISNGVRDLKRQLRTL